MDIQHMTILQSLIALEVWSDASRWQQTNGANLNGLQLLFLKCCNQVVGIFVNDLRPKELTPISLWPVDARDLRRTQFSRFSDSSIKVGNLRKLPTKSDVS